MTFPLPSFFLRPVGTHLLLFTLSLLFLLPGTATLPLMDRDEPKFAQATVEMMDRDDWVIPWLNDEYRFDKPPLTYWWMRAHVTIFGPGEFASRLHSVLASALTAMAIAALGSWLFSARAGLLAGLGWVTCLQVLAHVGRLCVADMPMILGVTVGGWALARLLLDDSAPARLHPPLWARLLSGTLFLAAVLFLWQNNLGFALLVARALFAEAPHMAHSIAAAIAAFALGFAFPPTRRLTRWWWLLLGAHIFAFLAKGPIALAVPVLGLLLTRWLFGRSHRWEWARLQPLTFLPLFLLGIGLWGIPAIAQTKGAFFDVGIGEHVVERGTSAFNGRIPVPGFYFFTALLSLVPWAVLIPEALRRDARPRSAKQAYLLGWLAAPYVIFFFYSTQLPHYIVPGLPAFFLLLFAKGQSPVPTTPFARRWAVFAAGLLLVVAVLVFTAAFLLPFPDALAPMRHLILLVGGIAMACGLASAAATRGRVLPVIVLMFASIVCLTAASRIVRATNPACQVREVLAPLPRDTPFQAVAFTEPSLIYYTHKGWKMRSPKRIPKAAAWFADGSPKKPRATVFLLREWSGAKALGHRWKQGTWDGLPPDKDFSAAVQEALAEVPHESHIIRGYNNGRTSWVEILVAVTPEEAQPANARSLLTP